MKPQTITIDRERQTLRLTWADDQLCTYRLDWLRANCPCATCREQRSAAAADPLRLNVGPLPSSSVASAELIGNYALRILWADGHESGIYPFASLRASCPEAHEGNPPPFIQD